MSTLVAVENKALTCDRSAASARSVLPGLRILLLTPYTGGNLGDGAIQEAIIHHLRRRLSEPQFRLVTLSPRITSELHGLPSFPIASSVYDGEPPSPESRDTAHLGSRKASAGYKERIKRSLRRGSWLYGVIASAWRCVRRTGLVARRMERELRHLFRVYQLLKETDLLVMSGGGQIDDYWGGAFGHPYALFKWTSLARVTKTPVVFLSVGVCVLNSRLSRRFAHRALRLAEYRSYRDRGSKELLRDATFTLADPEYPDLAFSYPCTQQQTFFSRDSSSKRSVIGISPIAYLSPHVWPEHDPSVYERYLQTLCEFTAKVLEAGHTVVLFTSSLMDRFAVKDLQTRLQQSPRSESWGGRLQQVDQTCLDKQLEEIRKMDMVVASRLHGIILAHLLGKPSLAISYDRKVRAHMEDMAQERFCLKLRDCTLPQLWDAFAALELESPTISAAIRSKVKEYSEKLDQQYDFLLQLAGQTARVRRHNPAAEVC
ncbi:MAG: polysaccharide pyruvyl transferase family protein [Verrucomicrobiia bacterium]